MKRLFIALFSVVCLLAGCGHTELPQNPYFYSENALLTADVTTSDIVALESGLIPGSVRTERAEISIYEVVDMENGSLYKLKISEVENMDGFLNDARLNIYLYVTENEIYRLWSNIYADGTLVAFYDDDALMASIFDNEEIILQNGYLICRTEAMLDSTDGGAEGMHLIIEVEGDMVTSRMWNVAPNGETYFYERFVWQQGAGLISYISGFRAGADTLELSNISQCQ